ncbi:MAG: hypothetical protein ACK5EU_14750 [Pseudanabaena sp.]|jgi:hypothetical protein|nr:hypothetical protein [Pseudanabaena sp. M135S2SP2A07QC]MCA6572010.1 hypothetical protein [Pseudanabaena sp. M53BS1SP1A06MG]MCA6584166.1 hypothetical protein [Pseudanabaena sp. M34BS1SP1A06MG]MCA6585795.1 hypothetical protein [Pseudanabaena sp. M051S1SP1A06QC]MCA6588311.1 hypothetical protein [Pseudanabaena sp. M109S1SP1A06QC]MCA6590922.1 hypothetical protein [Pseudanabaena sp. M38BS1SP1A06MG]MCA6595236.1 hypothetical protein [Pseudanabaena sp. M046S1SP1A06QC]MCA6599906.1 hypothetical prot
MEIWEEISRQRVKYIVDSYLLAGDDDEYFDDYLEDLLQAYPPPQIELALVEILIEGWRYFPLQRGVPFLERSHNLLKSWENKTITPNISATQFRLITGLDPTLIFGISIDTHSTRSIFPSVSR